VDGQGLRPYLLLKRRASRGPGERGMAMRMKLIGIVALLLMLSGCAVQHPVTVDALSQPGAAMLGSYVIRSGSEKLNPEDLQFKWVAQNLEFGVTNGFSYYPGQFKALPFGGLRPAWT
jgi:hypothetical protein